MPKPHLSLEEQRQLQASDYLLTPVWGGPKKQVYYLPDGRQIEAIPAMRDFVVKDAQGKIIREGTRDANLDKGWLTSPPQVLKIHCSACDGFHDKQGQVKRCQTQRRAQAAIWERKARQQLSSNPDGDGLAAEVAELKALVKQLLKERKNGSSLQ